MWQNLSNDKSQLMSNTNFKRVLLLEPFDTLKTNEMRPFCDSHNILFLITAVFLSHPWIHQDITFPSGGLWIKMILFSKLVTSPRLPLFIGWVSIMTFQDKYRSINLLSGSFNLSRDYISSNISLNTLFQCQRKWVSYIDFPPCIGFCTKCLATYSQQKCISKKK